MVFGRENIEYFYFFYISNRPNEIKKISLTLIDDVK
jgi:hypothetical protein